MLVNLSQDSVSTLEGTYEELMELASLIIEAAADGESRTWAHINGNLAHLQVNRTGPGAEIGARE